MAYWSSLVASRLPQIDTQGAEYEILTGSAQALADVSSRNRRKLDIEVHKGQRLTGIFYIMHDRGFELLNLSVGALGPPGGRSSSNKKSARLSGLICFFSATKSRSGRFASPVRRPKRRQLRNCMAFRILHWRFSISGVSTATHADRLVERMRQALSDIPRMLLRDQILLERS